MKCIKPKISLDYITGLGQSLQEQTGNKIYNQQWFTVTYLNVWQRILYCIGGKDPAYNSRT